MKKLESFLNDYSWLLKLGIVLTIIIWATQVNVFFGKMHEKSQIRDKMYQAEDYAEREKAIQELKEFSRQIIRAADVRSRKSDLPIAGYFEDIKKIRLKNKDLYHRSLNEDLRSKRFDYVNILHGIYKPVGLLYKDEEYLKELESSRESYEKWVGTADIHKEDGDESFAHGTGKLKQEDLHLFLSQLGEWLMVFYRRSFFLIMLLYLARMAERKGILKTVLADKQKFALAVIFWPVLVGKYPYNVVREIIVEAELRRLGNVFRKLSPKEKLKIQSIANSDGYSGWLKNFRTENSARLQNSFLMALAVAITFHALFPVLASSAETHLARGDPLIMEQVAEDAAADFSGSDCQDAGAVGACIPEASPAMTLYVSEKLKIISEMVKNIRRSKKIDQVPLGWLFSCGNLTQN